MSWHRVPGIFLEKTVVSDECHAWWWHGSSLESRHCIGSNLMWRLMCHWRSPLLSIQWVGHFQIRWAPCMGAHKTQAQHSQGLQCLQMLFLQLCVSVAVSETNSSHPLRSLCMCHLCHQLAKPHHHRLDLRCQRLTNYDSGWQMIWTIMNNDLCTRKRNWKEIKI